MPTVAISRPASSNTSAAEIDTGTISPVAVIRSRRTGSSRPPPPCSAERMRRMTSCGDAGRVELLDRHLADDVVGVVAADALGALVEEQDVAAQVGGDDAVDGRVQDALQELGGAPQLVLELARERDVAEGEDRRLLLGEDADRRDRDHDAVARGRDELEVEVVDRLGAGRAADRRGQLLAMRRGDDLRQRPPRQAVARVAGDLLGGAVQVEDAPAGVEHQDAVGRAVDEGAVALDGAHLALLW